MNARGSKQMQATSSAILPAANLGMKRKNAVTKGKEAASGLTAPRIRIARSQNHLKSVVAVIWEVPAAPKMMSTPAAM
jgi:hypothetical protein